jgi:hypothetical protein
MSGQRSSDKEAAEFRLLYQVTTDDIKHVRRQQWATTCYALLLIAGILGFHDLLFHPSPIERIISVLSTYRSKLMTIMDHFSEISREALLETQSHYSRFQYHFYTMVLPFILVMFLAASFVAWFAYR